jgi:sigma-B regulation protein RsbU (phosphoserine phosphatase)
VNLGAVIAGTFTAAFVLRWPLQKRFVLTAFTFDQPRRQFILELSLYLFAGILASTYNRVVHQFPFPSTINLMVGVIAFGFFLSMDMALARERRIILNANLRTERPSRLTRFRPMANTFALVALATSALSVAVLWLVLAKGVRWMAKMQPDTGTLLKAGESLEFELIFVMGVLLLFIINMILSYARNLKLLFESQTRVLEKVSEGNLDLAAPVAGANEFGVIAQHTNRMIQGLKHRLALLTALKTAEEVQAQLLPQEPPDNPHVRIAAASRYSELTGGDYYDFIETRENDLIVAVGDISGHGISSALLMTSARAFLRSALDRSDNPAEAAAQVNRRLAEDVAESGSFLTLFLLKVMPDERRLTWVRGGHDPAYLFTPTSGNFTELSGRGMALGLSPDTVYESHGLDDYPAGSMVVIGTDGIWETQSPSGEAFGKQRFQDVIAQTAPAGPQAALDAVFEALEAFRGKTAQADDVTLVLVQLD